MTGSTRSSEGLDGRRRKLLFRSWHRGMRELDLILGGFADAEIAALNDAQLDQYERLLDIPDTEFLTILTTGRIPAGMAGATLLRRILESRGSAAIS